MWPDKACYTTDGSFGATNPPDLRQAAGAVAPDAAGGGGRLVDGLPVSSTVPNIGNSCYLGSTLLLLSQCKPRLWLSADGAHAVQTLLDVLKNIEAGETITPRMVEQIQEGLLLPKDFVKGSQADSNEVCVHTIVAAQLYC